MTQPAIHDLRAHLALLVRLAPWRFAAAVALAVFLGLAEGGGLLLLIPLLQLIGLDVGQGATGRVADLVGRLFAAAGLRPSLPAVLAIYVAIFALQALLRRWQTVVGQALTCDIALLLRQRLYRAIADAGWAFLSRQRASDFTHTLFGEVDRAALASHYLSTLLANTAVVLAYVTLALQLSPPLSALVFAAGIPLLLLRRHNVGQARAIGEAASEAAADLYAATIEHMASLKIAKSYDAVARNAATFVALAKRVAGTGIASGRNHATAVLLFELGAVLALSSIVYVAFALLALPTATVLMLLFLFARIIPKLGTLQQHLQHCLEHLPALRAVLDLEASCAAAAEPPAAGKEDIILREAIRFQNVSFAYERGDEVFALRDLDLTIRAGTMTALVGPSGAGKSTLADLLVGLIAPERGAIMVDGRPLTPGRVHAWRRQIGYVAQETFLFHDTVRANLLWARPAASAGDIAEALRLAAADDFVAALPQGLDTIVGDRGTLLAAGERQRLALARALLRQPTLLLLDEATSNLDSENERRIQEAIERLHGRITIIVITHRLSTIRRADVIHVLVQGRLVESGTWSDLIARADGHFRALCAAQGIADSPRPQGLAATGKPR